MDEAVQKADLRAIAREVVEEYPEQAEMYRKGGPMLGFLVGRAMKKAEGRYPVAEVQEALREVLND